MSPMAKPLRTQAVLVPKPVEFEVAAPESFKEKVPPMPEIKRYTPDELRAIKDACTRLGFTAGSFVCPRKGFNVEHGMHNRLMVTWVYDNQIVGATQPFAPIECRTIKHGVAETLRFWPEELYVLWTSPTYTELDAQVKEWAQERQKNLEGGDSC